jgi:hypothetical protein
MAKKNKKATPDGHITSCSSIFYYIWNKRSKPTHPFIYLAICEQQFSVNLSSKMKYGEYLISQQLPEWREHYLNYDRLKKMIKDMEAAQMPVTDGATGNIITMKIPEFCFIICFLATSLSIPRPTNAAGVPISGQASQEDFYVFLEQEMKKIESFTKTKVFEQKHPSTFLHPYSLHLA